MPWIDLTASVEVNNFFTPGKNCLTFTTKDPNQRIKMELYGRQITYRNDNSKVTFDINLIYEMVPPNKACPPPTVRFATFWLLDGAEIDHSRYFREIKFDRCFGNSAQISVSREHLNEAATRFEAAEKDTSKKFAIDVHVHALLDSQLLPEPQVENARALCGMGAFRGEVFEKDSITNFVVASGAREFHVHRGILAARSEYFARMLDTDMTEKSEQRLTMDFCGPEEIEKFLTKVYDPEHVITSDSVQETFTLTKLFHMYEMTHEFQQCRELMLKLGRDVTQVSDICILLEVAHLYGFNEIFMLGIKKLRLMKDHKWQSPELQKLSRNNPELLLAALEKACNI